MDIGLQTRVGEERAPRMRNCEFCKGGMPADATVCMHCGREASAVQRAKRKGWVVKVAWTAGIIVAALIGIAIFGSLLPPEDPATRVANACAEQFPNDELARTQCSNEIMYMRIMENEGAKLRRAAAASH